MLIHLPLYRSVVVTWVSYYSRSDNGNRCIRLSVYPTVRTVRQFGFLSLSQHVPV